MFVVIGILVGCGSGGSGGGGSTPGPTATLTANPTSIPQGQSTILSFTSTNADSGTINNNVGPVGLNSQVTVIPPATTTYPNTYTYTYTASGPGGSATANATVTVTAPTAVSLTAAPASIVAGQTVALSWTSANATSVYISSSIGANVGAVSPVSGGTLTLPAGQVPSPTQTTTYTATATGADNQQVTATATVTVAPLTSFDGMLPDTSNATNTDIDPNGAAGTKQFMEYVNTEYQAFDKTTFQPVLTPSTGLAGQAVGVPWTNPLNPTSPNILNCIEPHIVLDVVILFDKMASRWVIAGKGVVAGSTENYYFCIAVSNTDDASSPSFGWYAYSYPITSYLLYTASNGSPAVYFPDWTKLGTWSDAYYASMDMLGDNNSVENGVLVCAFDRTDMLNGVTTISPQCFIDQSLDSGGIYLGHSLIPADFNGTTAPPSGRDEYLVSIQNPVNDGTTTTSTTFNLWDFHVDWTNPGNTTHTLTPITVSTYTPGCYLFAPGDPADTICVLQPPSSTQAEFIDSVGDRFMPRFDYRNFGSYESFLVSHTIQTGLSTQNPLQTGVRWYELRDSGTGSPSVYQDGLISPDDSQFRFLPSIAQDSAGNAAAGYSVSNNTTDPGINFSYWNLGTTNAIPAEVPIYSGAGEELTPGTGSGKWGSYSSMTVDPIDDCTFWYVNEYWPTNSDWATRIAFFKLPSCQ